MNTGENVGGTPPPDSVRPRTRAATAHGLDAPPLPRARCGAGYDIRRGFHLLLGSETRLVIGSHYVLHRDMTIECRRTLEIGDRTIFGHHCALGVVDSLIIGPDCLIAEMVAIRNHDNFFDGPSGLPVREQGTVCAPVKTGSNVWLGEWRC